MDRYAEHARRIPREGAHYRTVDLHSRNPGEFAPRRGGVLVDTIVVHYTATQSLSRRIGAASFLRRLDSAVGAAGTIVELRRLVTEADFGA